MAFSHFADSGPEANRKLYERLASECETGSRLSACMKKNGLAPFDAQLVGLAENTGEMVSVFHYLSSYYRLQHETYLSIKSALFRPVSTIVVGLVTAPLVAWVSGKISILQYAQMTVFPMLAMAIFFWLVYQSFFLTHRSRVADRVWFSIFSQLSLTMRMVKGVALERFFMAIQFAIKCGNGLPIALEAARQATSDPDLKYAARFMEKVAAREGLVRAFERAQILTPNQLNYLRTGELSGNNESMCAQICTDLKASIELETARFRRAITVGGFLISTAYAVFVILGGYSAVGIIP